MVNHLENARQYIEYAESQYGMGERDSAARDAQMATAHASIAQAEGSRPRFVRLGHHTINLAHIAYIDWHHLDSEGKRCVEITFLAASQRAALGLVFYGDEAEPVAALLRSVLEPYTVAELDFPEPETPSPDGYAFTVLEEPTP